MTKEELKALLDAEVAKLARKSFASLLQEFSDVVAYERGCGAGCHQFEVQLIEREPDYVHVLVSVDDGSFLRSLAPISRGLIVHRDGRVDL